MPTNRNLDAEAPLYPPRRPEIASVSLAEFYAYQSVAIGGSLLWSIAAGCFIPFLLAPWVVGTLLFASQQWQRHGELERYAGEYRQYTRRRQGLHLASKEGGA